jgi:hypothetical protein
MTKEMRSGKPYCAARSWVISGVVRSSGRGIEMML